jgi:hypothetical protein
MADTLPDDLWREFPKTAQAFEARFKTEEDCRAYLMKARWGGKHRRVRSASRRACGRSAAAFATSARTAGIRRR